jgi:hypothetical protein
LTELKERKAISPWIKYELDTKELDPPEIELKLSPIESISNVDSWGGNGRLLLYSEVVLQKAMISVADWKLKQGGEPLPIKDPRIKERVLRRLLGEKLKGSQELLGNAIMEYAQNLDNFSKN